MKPLDGEAPGQRIARARRRRGLSQAVLAGLVGRSESWLSQVERGKRGIDSHSVLTRLAEILRVDVAEITGPGPGGGDTHRTYPAAPLIEQTMMGYGASRPGAQAQAAALRTAFPQYAVNLLQRRGDRPRFEVVSRDGGNPYCLISTDALEIWQELQKSRPSR